jgi:hypothetical protein
MRVPDLMIGSLLAAAAPITTCLSYTHSYSAIAIPHIQQPRFTLIHRVYSQQSSFLTAYSLNPRLHCRHSQLALNYTLQSHYASLVDYRRILKRFSAVLPELPYWLPHCLGVLRTLTHTRSLTQSQIQSLLTDTLTDSSLTHCHYLIRLGWFSYIVPERCERTRRKHRLRHRSIVASRTTS